MLTNDQWVAVEKETKRGVAKFFNPELKAKLNTEKYEAVNILEYLQGLNSGKYKTTMVDTKN